MNIIVIIKFMKISFEVLSVAATMLLSGWWALDWLYVRISAEVSLIVLYETTVQPSLH